MSFALWFALINRIWINFSHTRKPPKPLSTKLLTKLKWHRIKNNQKDKQTASKKYLLSHQSFISKFRHRVKKYECIDVNNNFVTLGGGKLLKCLSKVFATKWIARSFLNQRALTCKGSYSMYLHRFNEYHNSGLFLSVSSRSQGFKTPEKCQISAQNSISIQ